MDKKTRKFITMNKELYPRRGVSQLYVSRENGGRGLVGCENSVKSDEMTQAGTSRTIQNHYQVQSDQVEPLHTRKLLTFKNSRKLKRKNNNNKNKNGL